MNTANELEPALIAELDEEIRRSLQKKKEERNAELRDCPTCGTPYHPTKEWQRFCSVACKSSYHNEREEIRREKKVLELARLKQDNEELVKENSALRKEIARLDKLIKKLKE